MGCRREGTASSRDFHKLLEFLLATMGPFFVHNNRNKESLYCRPIPGSVLHLSGACFHPRRDCFVLNAQYR